jgi:hypothetical protein
MWHPGNPPWPQTFMDFTELYRQSSSLVTFSPGAHFILTAVQDRVIVRRADTFQITRTWLVDPSPTATHAALVTSKQQKTSSSNTTNSPTDLRITHLAWSCDSEYILAACAKRGAVHIFKLRDEEWSGRIDAGAEGSRLTSGTCCLDLRAVRSCASRMGA